MTTEPQTGARANLTGSVWMILAMAAFAVEDMLLKVAASDVPIGQLLMLFGLGGALVFAMAILRAGEPLYVPEATSRPMLIRVGFELVGRLFYVLAIALIPLSTATVILQATPLVVVLGAVIVFGEPVGPRRWLALALGFLGVVIIVQPGMAGFDGLSLLAVLGMLGFAGRDLASRAAPAALSTQTLGFYGFLAVVLAGGLYAAWDGTAFVVPSRTSVLALIFAVIAGVVAYGSLMKAMRTGEVSAVTPFRYTRLLFGVALGVVIFGEPLPPATLLGSGLIVLSGLFIMWRSAPR